MDLKNIIIVLVFVVSSVPNFSFAATTQNTLGKEFVSSEQKEGIAIRVKPPAGWAYENVEPGKLLFATGTTSRFAGMLIQREINPELQKSLTTLADPRIQKMFGMDKKSKFTVAGMPAFSVDIDPKTIAVPVYGKQIFFLKNGYVYGVGIMASSNVLWKKNQAIMEKSMKTLSVI